ncbi:MAG TPA: acyl-CoA dehydrogenase family protein [Fimbriimonadaceae bacterium]|nr:acyl-CoA dehydrogenase family protein [Fimbriimonadaceae bacterium]
MSGDEQVLAAADSFLRESVAPNAQDIDLHPEALAEALRGLCERNLMALRRPPKYGGPDISEESFRRFQEQVARYSGSLAFLQTQHQSAGSMIAKSDNEELKQQYLPRMGNGERLVGIGFSQLRRTGPPVMRATQEGEAYILDGLVPWITGFGFYHDFLIGATLPDGRAVFGVVPFEAGRFREGEITFSEPMKLAAMESAQTVSAELRAWRLEPRLVAFVKPPGWIQNNDMINIVLQGHFALGCARGALDVLQAAAEKKGLPFLGAAYEALDAELEACREATVKGKLGEETDRPISEEKLRIRAWAIDLAVRCAHAAVTASSGAANSLQHPAQRIYREALVYTVSAQTSSIMEATLNTLVSRGPR